jgi:hypothetical protein
MALLLQAGHDSDTVMAAMVRGCWVAGPPSLPPPQAASTLPVKPASSRLLETFRSIAPPPSSVIVGVFR